MRCHHNTSDDLCRWAVLLGRLLTTLRPLCADLGLRFSLVVVVYLTGLLTQQNVTVTEIATQVGFVRTIPCDECCARSPCP
jgi:hypothetical protein